MRILQLASGEDSRVAFKRIPAATRKRWSKALRSGEYKQSTGTMCSEYGWCCLGVLLDNEIDGDWVQYERLPDQYQLIRTGSGSSMEELSLRMPSQKIGDQLGLDDSLARALAGLNDSGGSFDIIADLIDDSFSRKGKENEYRP